MSRGSNFLDFDVTLVMSDGDSVEICARVGITKTERILLKQCYRDDEDIRQCAGLEDLCLRVEEAAKHDNEFDMAGLNLGDGTEYDYVSSRIEIPHEIADEVEEEDGIEEETEESLNWEDYSEYPFAMETVNGCIISMTAEMQERLRAGLLNRMKVTEAELCAYLSSEDDGKPRDNRISLIIGEEYVELTELLGFDADEGKFDPEGIGFLESEYGWEAKDLLQIAGFSLYEDIRYGAHGHDTNGVYYISEL